MKRTWTDFLPAGIAVVLIVAYVTIVALFRRKGTFDLIYHVIVLILMGFALSAATPFREIATTLLATIFLASFLGYLFGTGERDPRGRDPRKYRRR